MNFTKMKSIPTATTTTKLCCINRQLSYLYLLHLNPINTQKVHSFGYSYSTATAFKKQPPHVKPSSSLKTAINALKFDDLKAIYEKQSKSQIKNALFKNFEEIPHLPEQLLLNMNKNGIIKPTEVQGNMLAEYFQKSDADLMIKSRPGSGKSLGYIILLLSEYYKRQTALIKDTTPPTYLIFMPSELLANQLKTWIDALTPGIHPTNTPKVNILNKDNCEKNCADIMIATPELFRLKMAQGLLDIKSLKLIIIDEADALIKPLKRFATQKQKDSRQKHPVTTLLLLSEILATFSQDKLLKKPRMIIASATLNKLSRDQLIFTKSVKNPVFIEESFNSNSNAMSPSLSNKTKTNNNNIEQQQPHPQQQTEVTHFYSLLKDPQDVDELTRLLHRIITSNNLSSTASNRGLLFLPADQSKMGLCELLKSRPEFSNSYTIGLLNEYKHSQETALNSQLLIASDVDCRGIDIPELSFVIVLDLPKSIDHYIHMTGRLGRVSSKFNGNVYTILGTQEDFSRYTSLINQTHIKTIPYLEIIN